jgi:hypothetical protein
MYSKYRELTARLCELFISLDVKFGGKKDWVGPKDSMDILEEKRLLLLTRIKKKIHITWNLNTVQEHKTNDQNCMPDIKNTLHFYIRKY